MTRPIYDHVHAMRDDFSRLDRVCERCGTPEIELRALREPMFDVPTGRAAADAITAAAIAADALSEDGQAAAKGYPYPRHTPPLPPEPRELPVARIPGDRRRTAGFVALMAFCGLVVALGAHELEREIDALKYDLDVANRRADKLRLMVHTHHRTTIDWDGDRRCIASISHESGHPVADGVQVVILGGGGPAMATCDDFAWSRRTTHTD